MSGLLLRASARFYRRHPWQLVLAIAGICLGIAVYVGVDLANDSARRAFEQSSTLVRGSATHRLLPLGADLDERVYVDLVSTIPLDAAPVLETPVSVPALGNRQVTLLGVDPLSEVGIRSFSSLASQRGSDIARLITEPGSVLASQALLDQMDLPVGGAFTIATDSGEHTVVIVATLSDAASEARVAPLILADISTAQELTGRTGLLSRIDLRIDAPEVRELGEILPAGAALVPAASEDETFDELARAFETNITALGLLALVVGMFLIYATTTFAIVQRREFFGVLRALGVTRAELVAVVLREVVALGIIGTALGIIVGQQLAHGLVDMVLQTMGDFSFSAAASPAPPSRSIYLQSAILGIGASVLAALGPLREAGKTAPALLTQRAVIEAEARRRSRTGVWFAVPLLLLASILLEISDESLIVGFLSVFLVLSAGALVTPASTTWLMRLAEPIARRTLGLPGVLATRNVVANLSRTGIAAAALAVAVATVMGIGIMIASFRSSLEAWLDSTLTADIVIRLEPTGPAAIDVLAFLEEPETQSAILAHTETRFARLPTPQGPIALRATEPGPDGWDLDIVAGEGLGAARQTEDSPAIVVSEPLAFRLGLVPGDTLELPTASGPADFSVSGVFRDYSSTYGSAVMPLASYRRMWNDHSVSGIGIHLADGTDPDAIVRRIRDRFPAGLDTRTTRIIRDLSMTIFDRTFQITEVLRLLAGIVAFLGVVSAFLAIQLERAHEYAVLRAIGFSPADMSEMLLAETGLLGSAAGLTAIPIGGALAGLLVFVINQRSFGWTMHLTITPGPVFLGVILAIGAALLAGLIPSIGAYRSQLAAALRDE